MSLDSQIEQLVADHLQRKFPQATPRSTRPARVAGKADAVIGMRRVGKTYLLFQTLQELESGGVPRERTLYVNFEDERLAGLQAKDLALFTEALWRRNPATRGSECWLLLDEVQLVPGWEQFVRRVQDSEHCRVIVSGSSARLLSTEVATSLRGRGLTTELLPFSYAESLLHRGDELPAKLPPPSTQRSALEAAFREYLEVGGFPEIQRAEPDLRRRIVRDYVDVVLLRDVAERHGISNLVALRAMVRRLLRSMASPFSAHKLYGELKSQQIAVAKDAVHEYLAHLQDAFLLFAVERWSTSVRQRQVNPKKCYLIDTALASTFASASEDDRGHKLENVVYLELRRRGGAVSYYVTESGFEVDFFVERDDGNRELVQACTDTSDPATLEREVRALHEAMAERKLDTATIVTSFDERQRRDAGRTIRLVPAWRWMLERP